MDNISHILAHGANIDVAIKSTSLAVTIDRTNFDAIYMLFDNNRSQQPYLAYCIFQRTIDKLLVLKICKILIQYCVSLEHEYDNYDPHKTPIIEENKLVFHLLLRMRSLNYRISRSITHG